MRTFALTCLAGLAGLALACSEPKKEAGAPSQEPAAATESPAAPGGPGAAALRQRASALFGTLPDEAKSDANPVTDAKIALGRALYFDPRFSTISLSA